MAETEEDQRSINHDNGEKFCKLFDEVYCKDNCIHPEKDTKHLSDSDEEVLCLEFCKPYQKLMKLFGEIAWIGFKNPYPIGNINESNLIEYVEKLVDHLGEDSWIFTSSFDTIIKSDLRAIIIKFTESFLGLREGEEE